MEKRVEKYSPTPFMASRYCYFFNNYRFAFPEYVAVMEIIYSCQSSLTRSGGATMTRI